MNNSSSAREAASLLHARPLALAAAFLAAFPCLTLPAFAQQQNVAIAGSQVIVTATRNNQLSSEILVDHDVINAQEIMAAGHSSVAELLLKKRGFEISSNGGPANVASVFMRGTSNTQSIVLVDGVRIGSATSGGPTWSSIPLSQIERIEIVYGPLSSMYGADAMGGVVQIFTKQGTNSFEPSIGIGAGSRGVRKYDLGFAGSSGGEHALRFSLNAVHEEDNGYSATKPAAGKFSYNSDEDGYTRDSVTGSMSYKIMAGHELGTNLMRSRQNSRFDAGPSYDDRDVTTLETWSIYSKNQWTKEWSSQLRYANSEDRSISDASYGLSRFDSKQAVFGWQNDISLGKDTLQLVYEHRTEKANSSTKELNKERTTRSFAAAYQWKYEQHLASFSLRNDDISTNGKVTTGNLAYGYRFTKQWRLSTSFGTSFRAPSFNELYYPGYGVPSNRPEKGKNLEVGMVYDNDGTHLSASLYRNRITDLLVYASTCPVKDEMYSFGCAINLNKVQLTGLSVGGNTTLGNKFILRGSLDWQDAVDQTTGLRLPRRARQHASFGLDYADGAIKGGVETILSGQRFDDVNNKNSLAGYTLVNLFGSYELNKKWSVQARWNNILNKNYELARNYQSAGSNLFVALRYGEN